MCVVFFDEERLDAIIMEIKENQLFHALTIIAEANEHGFDAILTYDDFDTVNRRRKKAGSVKRFLALLEASSKKVNF